MHLANTDRSYLVALSVDSQREHLLKLAQKLSYKLPKVYILRMRQNSTSTHLKATVLSDEVSDLTQIKNSAVLRISLTDQAVMKDETCKTENSSELNLISNRTDSSSSHLKQKFYEDTDKFSICNINTSKNVRFLNVNENNKDQVNMTGVNDERSLEPTCNVSSDSETKNESIIEAIEIRKPLVRSVVEGNFLPINNGFITKFTEPLTLETIDEIPIIIMNCPIEHDNEERIALYPSLEDDCHLQPH
ncbi:hypothetical protein KQX54_001780 [Cotesia glomerata]|uniref:Uncharacterized protein n=1 Tax=Cotesia glomerata TaxID=32391 RepID=A0AAV7IBY8_COTGL|nr:hypothetical protein KQX54_001780 [Cotesia glomerata]